MRRVETPNVATIAELCEFLDIPAERTAKAVVVDGEDGEPVLLVLRGDHQLNDLKAARLPGVADPVVFTDEAAIRKHFGAGPGSLGPVDATVRIIADHALRHAADFVTGANEDGRHLAGVNWGRDLPEPEFADLREARAGDPSPDGKGRLQILRGIEVGHIFQLGRKYSESMHLTVLDEAGREVTPEMGCYGVGISRIVAAAIEQGHDEGGMVWPPAIAPFELIILPIKADKSQRVREAAEALYTQCLEAGVDAVLDDRGLRPGPMFADADLIGIPHRIVVGERTLDESKLEYKARTAAEPEHIDHDIRAVLTKVRT
jgi:prolyl-tRNA synthetase